MYEADTYTQGRSGNEFMIGLLCGAAVGAAVGLLLAPKTGAELRSQLADTAERFRRGASDTYDRASQTMKDSYSSAAGQVNDLMDKGREAVRRGRETFEEARRDATAG
jgi:gas vesicle protein